MHAIVRARRNRETLRASDLAIDPVIAYEVQSLVSKQLRPTGEIIGFKASHPRLQRDLRDCDVILTGGLTDPLDLELDGWISARFEAPGWSTGVTVERRESA